MTPLRKQMIEVLELRGSSAKTVKLYVNCVARFAQHFGKSPEQLGEKEVRTYLLHLMQTEKVAVGTYKQALAAIRFLYRWVLQRGDVVQDIRTPRPERRLPVVLSFDEVHRFFAAIPSFKHRTLLMFAYAAGILLSELYRQSCRRLRGSSLCRPQENENRPGPDSAAPRALPSTCRSRFFLLLTHRSLTRPILLFFFVSVVRQQSHQSVSFDDSFRPFGGRQFGVALPSPSSMALIASMNSSLDDSYIPPRAPWN